MRYLVENLGMKIKDIKVRLYGTNFLKFQKKFILKIFKLKRREDYINL